MSLPEPVPGLVINYSYLWVDEQKRGCEDGSKARPCAIVVSRQIVSGHLVVTVAPITHSPPRDAIEAIEIPAQLKSHLGLDDDKSWVVVTETNSFVWPGPDLRPIGRRKPLIYAYGMLPPRFFNAVRDGLLLLNRQRRLRAVKRSS